MSSQNSNALLITQLFDLINRSLKLDLYDNAVFYSERLLCENKSEEVKLLLAKGYMGQGKFHQAYQILRETKSHDCRYLFVLICIKLNKFIDAEKALLTGQFYTKSLNNKEIEKVIPNGAAGYYLLGIVLEKLSRKSEAISAYKKSIEMDPFMWNAYEKLCKLEPNKLENNKIYSELNPNIVIFNQETNDKMNKIKNSKKDNNKKNKKNNDNDDLLFSPDEEHNNNFNISNNKRSLLSKSNNNNFDNSTEMNKYRTILDFSNTNINNNNNTPNNIINTPENMTPEVHKEECDYSHLNCNINNFIPVKNPHNNNIVFSSTPHHIQLDFNNSSYYANNISGTSNNNSININNNNLNNNLPSSSGFNMTNNNSMNDISSSRINPFNINISNNLGSNNLSGIINLPNNISNNNNSNPNVTPSHIPQPPSSLFNNVNNSSFNISTFNNNYNNNSFNMNNNQNQNNIFTNINLGHNIISSLSKPHSIFTNNNQNNNSISKNSLLKNINVSPTPNTKIKKEENQTSNIYNLVHKGNQNLNTSSFQNICQLLKYYSEILKKLFLFDCQNAIDLLLNLPQNHFKSPYIYSLLGRCYFECGEYKKCEKYYNLSISTDPSYLTGLEYFSSCLWHLKDQIQCCNLANNCKEQNQFAPETWIVLGNCFSLQKEHEIAIKFFKRASQINPSFAYAYTLEGHEYVENENYIKATECYKQALNYDERHFNAWWGLGHIQLKEQNYSEAIKYFKKAAEINPNSAIIHFYLASANIQNRDLNAALKYLQIAEKKDNKNPMVKYQLSNIYYDRKEYDKALNILLELDEKMPKEAPIHIAIGKNYIEKKDYKKALDHFNKAIDLDPKDSNLAKSYIERLYNEVGVENLNFNKL